MPFQTTAIRKRGRRRIAALVRAGAPCHLCGRSIDLSVPWPDPMSFVVDHVIPTSRGGSDDFDQRRPAHNRCNRTRSADPLGTVGQNSGALG